MQNRIIIKQIKFENNKNFKNIKIKLYHNNIIQTSDILWNYTDEIINWKFIINYNEKLPIDFVIFERDIFDNEIILGNIQIINKNINYNIISFPQPIINEEEVNKNFILIIHQYILSNKLAYFYPCGSGWNLPDTFPKLIEYPIKNNYNIYNSIKIVKDNFDDQKPKYNYYSQAFLKIINDKNNIPPFCFGIIGPDNFGKTDLLTSLRKNLHEDKENNKKRIIINFNPWSFEADDTIWASILMRIHDELEKDIGKFNLKWIRIKQAIFPNNQAIYLFILKILLIILGTSIFIYFNFQNLISNIFVTMFLSISTLLLLKDLIQLWKNFIFSVPNLILSKIKKPDWTKELGFMHQIKKEFFDFINPIVIDKNYQIILLIDDLDKCSIEKIYLVIKVLSLIKYSDCPIYMILTYNSQKINEAIKNYYKLKYHCNNGTNMINKLINIPFCLPGRDIVENLNLLDNLEDSVIINMNHNNKKGINYDLNNIEINSDNLNIYQLENYLLKNNNTELKNKIFEKILEMKKNFTKSYYMGLDDNEIKLFQLIIENTKNSEVGLTNDNVVKVINIYSISRFLLSPYLKIKKEVLLHFIVITEIWLVIMIKIYHEIKKNKFNLSYTEIKEKFQNKKLVEFSNKSNFEFISYLNKFELTVLDFIDLEPYIFNLDRCYN